MGLSCLSWRATALITPRLAEFCNPSGLPNPITSWPRRNSRESPRVRCGKSVASIFSTTTSASRSSPTILASRTVPAGFMIELLFRAARSEIGNCTRMRRAPWITCALRDRQLHANAPCALDHVRVGHDVAVRSQDDARAGGALPGKQAGVARIGVFADAITGSHDLDHRAVHPLRQRFQRRTETLDRLQLALLREPGVPQRPQQQEPY